MTSMNELAISSSQAGTAVNGTVGSGANALTDAWIYRRGNDFLVVQNNVIRSYVPNATPGVGIVQEYLKLGGQL
jgi:hypothetical protein